MNISRITVMCVTVAIIIPVSICAGQQIIRLSDRRPVEFAEMMEEIKASKVILVGETHYVKRHHDMQLDIIRALHGKGMPLAIGLEMFPVESQKQLDRWTKGKMIELSLKWVFARYWAVEWSLYRDIFIFARDNHIPMIALNIPKQTMAKVMKRGFAALEPEDKQGLPSDVTCILNTPYTEFLRKIYAHHAQYEKSFTYFCEAQTLYNSGMASNIAQYLRMNPGTTVVTLAGAWHTVKSGIPEQLERYGVVTYKVIVPELPGFRAGNASLRDADFFFK